MTLICVPVFIKPGIDVEEAVGQAEDVLRASGTSDPGILELRCDTATPKQLLAALDLVRLPVIVTIRPTWEGGFSQKTDNERIALWQAAMEQGAEYVDIELASWEKSRAIRDLMADVGEKHGTRLILSHHCFEKRPADLPQRLHRLLAVKQAAVLKIAWKAESILDAIEALRLMKETRARENRSLLAIAMGEEGLLSRLLAKKFAAPFTFASAEPGKESAPRQPTVAELRQRYRWDKQHTDTPIFGVIGWPVGHSLSPHIHNAGFDAVQADGVYVPLPIKPAYEDFAAAVNALRACPGMNLRGLSVTIPHKENAVKFVRESGGRIDELSGRVGVINTIIFPQNAPPTGGGNPSGEGGVQGGQGGGAAVAKGGAPTLFGLNSDYAGALDALATAWSGQRQDLAGKHIAVLGAGGAARAIVAGLAASHASVVIYNRTFQKAAALAAEFNTPPTAYVRAAPWETLATATCDAYVNCTPLGMHPNVNTSPLDGMDQPAWTSDTVVFDTVYNPLMTKLLKLTKKKGAKIVTGSEMFIRQAAVQFQAFTGKEAPMEVFRRVMAEELSR